MHELSKTSRKLAGSSAIISIVGPPRRNDRRTARGPPRVAEPVGVAYSVSEGRGLANAKTSARLGDRHR
jgi:hypothetical protein